MPIATICGRLEAVLDPLPLEADAVYADVGGLIVTLDRRRILRAHRWEGEGELLLRIGFADVTVEIQEAVA